MSNLTDSIVESFMSGKLWKPPVLQWVKVIRSTSVKEITVDGMFNDDFNWIELDEPVVWRIPETQYCVVADYGDGPHGYFVSDEEHQSEGVAQAMRDNRLQDVITIS